MKKMDLDFYKAIANRIREGYDIIIGDGIWNGDTQINGLMYSIIRPSYNGAAHYVFKVLDYQKECDVVASGEVSAEFVEEKIIRFYLGEAILHKESL